MTLVYKSLHDLLHLGDMPGRSRLVCRLQHSEQVERIIGGAFVRIAPGPPRDTRFGGLGQDFVVDIGDVADQGDVKAVPAG